MRALVCVLPQNLYPRTFMAAALRVQVLEQTRTAVAAGAQAHPETIKASLLTALPDTLAQCR
jgi:hypothetical protein